jgi:hypothetical protein
MKKTLCAVAILYSMNGFSQQGPPPGLTSEQQTCLYKILGEPGQGNQPTKEQMLAAAKACHLSPSEPPPQKEQSDE